MENNKMASWLVTLTHELHNSITLQFLIGNCLFTKEKNAEVIWQNLLIELP